MKLISLEISLLCTCLLVACGGSGSGSSPSPQSSASAPAVVEMINGIVVPPDPGAAKDATVAGVDTDHNGIRDEIDRWIAKKYGDKPRALDAIRMVARSSQTTLMSIPSNQQEARALVYADFDVGGCTYKKLDSEGVDSSAIFNESMLRTYNTKARIAADKHVMDIAGMILRNVGDTTIHCPYR